jgi:hypothetical protein
METLIVAATPALLKVYQDRLLLEKLNKILVLQTILMGKIFRWKLDFEDNIVSFSYIDQVSLVMQAKTATEILTDATLTSWHSFDGGSYYDSGPIGLNGTAVSITSVSGRVNQAISFTSSSSYYQVKDVKRILYYLCLNDLYRLVDLFFLVFQIIHIQLLYGFVHRQ